MKRIGTARRKTRHIYQKPIRTKGKISLTRYFQQFEKGTPVVMKSEPAVQKGMYFRRFHGKMGKVEGKQGNCYKVAIKDGKKLKTLVVHPVHLKRLI